MELTPQQVYQKFNKAIITIKSFDKDGAMAVGSAVVLRSKNVVVTNYHTIRLSSNFELYKDEKKIDYERVLAIDREKDLVILQLKDSNKYPVIKTSTKLIIGEKVFALGNPLQYGNSITEGRINGKNCTIDSYRHPMGVEFKNVIHNSAQISPGNSGGGLFNSKGELIGITTFTDLDGQNVNFAIPISEALNLIEKAPKISIHKNQKLEKEVFKFHSTLMNGDDNQALVHINNCLDIKSDDEYFLFNKIILLNNLDRGDEAIAVCDELLSKNPNLGDVAILKYLTLLKQLRLKEALQCLEESFSDQNDYNILCLKSGIYLMMTEYEKAYDFIQKAIILDNKEFLAYLSLVEYYTKTNQLFKAGRLAFKIKNEHPDLLIVSFLLGLVYFQAGKHNKAICYFDSFIIGTEQKIISRNETENVAAEESTDTYILSNARTLRLASMIFIGQTDDAFDDVNNLILNNPNNSLYYSTRAHILAIQSDFDQAFKDLNQAIKLSPYNSGAYFLSGMIHYYKGNYKEALKSTNQALKIMPNLIGFLNHKALTLICLGKYAEAIKISKQIYSIDNNAPEVNLITMFLLEEKKKPVEVLKHTKKLVKSQPNDYYYLSLYAAALCELKKQKEAFTYIEKSLRIKETILGLVIKSGILFELKKYRETISLFDYIKNKYKNIQPVLESSLWLFKGKAEMKLKLYGTAQLDLEEAIRVNPESEKAVRPLLKKIYKLKQK